MSKRLILTRHAKSSWDDPLLVDHDRVLNKRGREAAKALGDWLRQIGIVPDEVLSSTAKRTLETVERLGFSVSIKPLSALYHASAEQMLDVLQSASGDVVLVVAHNPGIADFAERLVAQPPDHMRFYDYPTAATMIADFEINAWSALRFGIGHVAHFVVPTDLY